MDRQTSANMKFLLHLIRVTYPNYNAHSFLYYMLVNYCDIICQKQTRKIIVCDLKTLIKLSGTTNVCDVNNSIILDRSFALNYGNLAIIQVLNDDAFATRRKVHVISADLSVGDEGAFVMLTSNLWHNLMKRKESATCNYEKSWCRLRKISNQAAVKFAEQVDLSLINSSIELSNFLVDNLLKSFFKLPKLMYPGDVIEVDLAQHGNEMFYLSTNKMAHITNKIYFKCNRVTINNKIVENNVGYYCMFGRTTLKQSANVQSFIPPTLFPEAKFGGEIHQCPYGLQAHFNQIKRAVQPFITKKNLHFKPVFLLEGRKGSGKQLLVKCIASYFGMHLYSVNNFDLTANVYAQNETKLRNAFFGAKMAAPAVLEIRNFENFAKNNEGQYDDRLINHFTCELTSFFTNSDYPLVIFCVSNDHSNNNIPIELKRVFLKCFQVHAPNEVEREQISHWLCKKLHIDNLSRINLSNVANRTHGFLLEDLRALFEYALCTFKQNQANSNNKQFGEEHIYQALDLMQSNYNESLGAPKVPKVQWSDVGGLGDVKDEIIKTIKLPLKHPELLKNTGLKRSGILLFGPPGTGKTLIAKAVATECGLCFLSVKGPELLNMYVGQSEENVREVFQRAREASPCIIFFDELDALAPNRGANGDSGGVMDRVVSQLLAEMDGLNDAATIFIIGATNRPDLIDPALLRPGRFDKLLYIGPCMDRDSKLAVLRALTKKFVLENEKVLDRVIDELCPENLSGADFYGVCSNAWMSAVRRLISQVEKKGNGVGNSYNDVIVGIDDFRSAIKNVKPSIKQEDLVYFNRLKTELAS